jgi:phosphatidylglycerol:prolipoprotein diacylglycerol transferase
MYPVIYKIPIFDGLAINSYGVMVALGFVFGIIWVTRESRRLGQDPARALDLVFYLLIAGIAGSRIFYIVISDWDRFVKNPLTAFQIWRGGLVFYGGFIACLIVGAWYIRRHRMPLLTTLDIFAPALAMGHAIGRIGCLLAGCCYGRVAPAGAWYALTFPKNPDSFAPGGVPLYPTQPMETAGEVIIFGILMLIRHYKKFDGQLMVSYFMLYAVLRYISEFFRGDMERGFIIDPWLSTSQFVSLIMFCIGLFAYIKLWPRRRME